jgi:hypothetical protein
MTAPDSSTFPPRASRIPLLVWFLGALCLLILGCLWAWVVPAIHESRATTELRALPGIRVAETASSTPPWWEPLETRLGFRLVPREHHVFFREEFPLEHIVLVDALRKVKTLSGRHEGLESRHFVWSHAFRRAKQMRLTGNPDTLIDLTPMERASVTLLELRDMRIDERGVAVLGRLPHLNWLELTGVMVDDTSIKPLVASSHLSMLGLRNTAVTFRGLHGLAGLPSLRNLILGGSSITDDGAELLPAHFGLELVQFQDCTNLTDAGLARMHIDPETLRLAGTGIRFTEPTVQWLLSRKRMKTVYVSADHLRKEERTRINRLGGPWIEVQ